MYRRMYLSPYLDLTVQKYRRDSNLHQQVVQVQANVQNLTVIFCKISYDLRGSITCQLISLYILETMNKVVFNEFIIEAAAQAENKQIYENMTDKPVQSYIQCHLNIIQHFSQVQGGRGGGRIHVYMKTLKNPKICYFYFLQCIIIY